MAYIIKPLVTEKMTGITAKQNKFGFIVRPDANKLQDQAQHHIHALGRTVRQQHQCHTHDDQPLQQKLLFADIQA